MIQFKGTLSASHSSFYSRRFPFLLARLYCPYFDLLVQNTHHAGTVSVECSFHARWVTRSLRATILTLSHLKSVGMVFRLFFSETMNLASLICNFIPVYYSGSVISLSLFLDLYARVMISFYFTEWLCIGQALEVFIQSAF